jgi:hypothetical protein
MNKRPTAKRKRGKKLSENFVDADDDKDVADAVFPTPPPPTTNKEEKEGYEE